MNYRHSIPRGNRKHFEAMGPGVGTFRSRRVNGSLRVTTPPGKPLEQIEPMDSLVEMIRSQLPFYSPVVQERRLADANQPGHFNFVCAQTGKLVLGLPLVCEHVKTGGLLIPWFRKAKDLDACCRCTRVSLPIGSFDVYAELVTTVDRALFFLSGIRAIIDIQMAGVYPFTPAHHLRPIPVDHLEPAPRQRVQVVTKRKVELHSTCLAVAS